MHSQLGENLTQREQINFSKGDLTNSIVESSLIYAASDKLKYKVNWLAVTSESEWSYFGSGNHVNKPLVLKNIIDYFPESSLFIAINRKDSIQVDKADIEKALDKILGFKNFLIWDKQFKRVIEFNDIGTMRQGHV